MGNLGAHQLLTRVFPNQPFGTGVDGVYSSATIPTLLKDYLAIGTATLGTTTLITAGTTFANGDVLMIYQVRGTGAGQWEVNRVLSGGGTATLTLQVPLNYSYITGASPGSSADICQIIKVKLYTEVTVQAGTWTIPSWDTQIGGMFPYAASVGTTVTGTMGSEGAGFLGGVGRNNGSSTPSSGFQGEGTLARGRDGNGNDTGPTLANGNGAGAGYKDNSSLSGAPGGGGGHATTGGSGGDSDGTRGTPGEAAGTADLTNLVFGGGGGGSKNDSEGAGAGGDGGGAILAYTRQITVTGAMPVDGSLGGNGAEKACGGGGAGGSVLLVCQTATLGTNLVTALGRLGGTTDGYGSQYGGTGSAGRIAIHHSGTITGTTNPTFTDVVDTRLVEAGGFVLFGLT